MILLTSAAKEIKKVSCIRSQGLLHMVLCTLSYIGRNEIYTGFLKVFPFYIQPTNKITNNSGKLVCRDLIKRFSNFAVSVVENT